MWLVLLCILSVGVVVVGLRFCMLVVLFWFGAVCDLLVAALLFRCRLDWWCFVGFLGADLN